MNQLNKGKAKYIFYWLRYTFFAFVFLLNTSEAVANIYFSRNLTIDTIPKLSNLKEGLKENLAISGKDTNVINTVKSVSDTIGLKQSIDTLSSPIYYEATDSMVLDVSNNKIFLYGKKSEVKYQDNQLAAPAIVFDQQTNLISAHLLKDSNGSVVAYPIFNQADFKTVSDTIQFNMKSKKGLTKGTYTQQGDMFVYGEKIKKIDNNVFFAQNGRFTTCNLDTPHFAFVSNKIKFINQKVAFTGPVHPEVEGIPLPNILPFGIYPMKVGFHSGFISPNFTANQQYGLAMEGLGYYKMINPSWDVVVRGTLYSYGGWVSSISPRYYKRYRYQGNFALDMQSFRNGFKGDPDFSTSKTFNIRWSHSADSKARPGVNFSANVNAGSSKFNAQVPNSPVRNFTNQLNSSITYSKIWKDKPYNISVSANHNQNTALQLINLNLPDIGFNVNTLYPFRKQEAIGQMKWYENLGVALNTNVKSLTSFYDSAKNIREQILKNFQWGATHSVPISLSLPSLGPLQVSPSISYQEKWYQERFIRKWNATNKKLDTVVNNGFYSARDMSYGIGMSTRIFGLVSFKKSSAIQAIRHEIRPNISINYKPNFNANSYYETQIDTFGRSAKYSYYERSIYGSFSDVKFGGMNFGLDNVIQMKLKNKQDTTKGAFKKVSLIDGLSVNGSYNFLVDSFKMSNLSLTARSNLFDKINITANAQFDPYLYDENGRRINKLVWTKTPVSLGRITSGGVSLQSRFSGGEKNKKNNNAKINNNHSGMPLDEFQAESAFINNNPNDYVDFTVPWDLDFSYSLRFSRFFSAGKFQSKTNQDVNINGNINITPKWKIGLSGSYNLSLHDLGVVTVNLSRELHCWQMSIVMSPVGKYRYFTLNISPKSGLLRDIKVNRTRYFYDL